MQYFAMVDNNVVQEIVQIPDDADVKNYFHASIVAKLIACDSSVTKNMGYVGGKFTSPAVSATPVDMLLAVLDQKERSILANTVFSHTLADGSDTLNTKNDDRSILLLNTLSGWALANIAAKPPATRNYYNLDNSSHTVSASNIAEFLSANGEFVQRVLDASVAAADAVMANPPTITTQDEINSFAWPTS